MHSTKKSLFEALPPNVRERILAVLMGHRHRLKFRTLWIYGHALGLLARRGNLETTMIYVYLRPDQPRRYDVVHVEIKDHAGMESEIAEGWEIALQTKDTVWFRRPRWVS